MDKGGSLKRQGALLQLTEISSSQAASNLLGSEPEMEIALSSSGLSQDKDSGALYQPLSTTIGSESISADSTTASLSFGVAIICALLSLLL